MTIPLNRITHKLIYKIGWGNQIHWISWITLPPWTNKLEVREEVPLSYSILHNFMKNLILSLIG